MVNKSSDVPGIHSGFHDIEVQRYPANEPII